MRMQKQITKLDKSRVELTVTVDKSELARSYQDLLQKYAKNAQIPGFRKGKVPVALMEKKYGEAIKGEVAGDIIEKSLDEIFTSANEHERPLPYSQPVMNEAPDFDIDRDLSYKVSYDVFPDVTLETVEGFKIEVPVVSVTEADIDQELQSIRERNAIVADKSDTDKASKDNIVTVNYCELDSDGAVIAGTERQDFVFTLGSGQNVFKFDDEITGMIKGETKDFTKKYPAKFEDSELAGQTKKLRVTLTALKERNLPDLDDELAQDVSEKYKNLADLTADIRKNMESALENKLREIKNTALLDKIVEKNSFELPESMVSAELESRWQMLAQRFRTDTAQLEKMILASGQSKEDMLSGWRPEAEKLLKSRVCVELLMKDRGIDVSDADVEAEFARIAEGAGISTEEVKNHYADPRKKEYLIDDIKEQRLYAQLLEKCTVSKGPKTAFADLFKNE